MKTEHKYAHLLRAMASGEVIQAKRDDEEDQPQAWRDLDPYTGSMECLFLQVEDRYEFRLKPRTITVNGREVQAGETVAPACGTIVFISDPAQDDFYTAVRWGTESCFARWLERGLVQLTKEAAIAHAKAMLNID